MVAGVVVVDGYDMVAYANGIGGVTVRDGAAAAAVQLLLLLLAVTVLETDGGTFFNIRGALVFDVPLVMSEGKSSSVTTPAGLRWCDTALDPSAVQPMVNRFVAFLPVVESSFAVVTVSCNDGNDDVI